jgi:hypothetical protein
MSRWQYIVKSSSIILITPYNSSRLLIVFSRLGGLPLFKLPLKEEEGKDEVEFIGDCRGVTSFL